jgi:hypothetical protein
VEAEKCEWMAEQLGHGGSLIKELRLLRSCFSRPSSSSLTAMDGSLLTTDSSKLEGWAEHFASVVNCGVDVCQTYLEL